MSFLRDFVRYSRQPARSSPTMGMTRPLADAVVGEAAPAVEQPESPANADGAGETLVGRLAARGLHPTSSAPDGAFDVAVLAAEADPAPEHARPKTPAKGAVNSNDEASSETPAEALPVVNDASRTTAGYGADNSGVSDAALTPATIATTLDGVTAAGPRMEQQRGGELAVTSGNDPTMPGPQTADAPAMRGGEVKHAAPPPGTPSGGDVPSASGKDDALPHAVQAAAAPGVADDPVQSTSNPGQSHSRPQTDPPAPVPRSPEVLPARPSGEPMQRPVLESVHRQDAREPATEVRIGQINVLVEEPAPARPQRRKGQAQQTRPNPFGLRGL